LFADDVPVTVECKAENNFEITTEQVREKITDETKAILVGFTNNPIGAVLSRKKCSRNCSTCRRTRSFGYFRKSLHFLGYKVLALLALIPLYSSNF
jgi:aspartate/methionine/tyrosine aminotransferase